MSYETFDKMKFISTALGTRCEKGKNKQAEKFKCLGKWVELNISVKEAFISQIKKMEMANQLTRCLQQTFSVLHAKLRYNWSVIWLQVMYTENASQLIIKVDEESRGQRMEDSQGNRGSSKEMVWHTYRENNVHN